MCVQWYPVEKDEWMNNQKSDESLSAPNCAYKYNILQLITAPKLGSIAEFGYISGVITNHTNSSS